MNMNRILASALSALALALAPPALAGDSILLDDFQGKGVFHRETFTPGDQKNSILKKGGYLSLVWKGHNPVLIVCAGDKKVDFSGCKSLSLDVRVRKKGETFDPSRHIGFILHQWEGGKTRKFSVDVPTESVPADGRWYRVTAPIGSPFVWDKGALNYDAVYSIAVILNTPNKDLPDVLEIDVDNLVAYPVAPAETTVTPIDK
jgi:hypothetical protein